MRHVAFYNNVHAMFLYVAENQSMPMSRPTYFYIHVLSRHFPLHIRSGHHPISFTFRKGSAVVVRKCNLKGYTYDFFLL